MEHLVYECGKLTWNTLLSTFIPSMSKYFYNEVATKIRKEKHPEVIFTLGFTSNRQRKT